MSLDSIQTLALLDDTERELNHNKRKLNDVEAEIAVVRHALTQAEQEMQQKEEEYQTAKTAFESVKQRLEENTSRLKTMEKQVMQIRNQKEFIASKMQVKDVRKLCSQLEDEYLEYEEKIEGLESTLDTAKTQVSEQTNFFEQSVGDLQNQSEHLKKQIAKNTKDYDKILSQLEPKLLQFYNRCLERGLYPVFARVTGTSCTGCNTELLPQLLNEMRTHPDSYRSCPFCFRIVYIAE